MARIYYDNSGDTKLLIDTASLVNIIFGVFFCTAIHILGYLSIVKEFVRKVKHEELLNLKELNEDENSSLQRETLAIISETSINTKTAFEDSLKTITDMLSDVNTLTSAFHEFYTDFFFLLETASLCSLFVCGLTFIVVHEQYVFAIGVLFSVLLLFFICFVNEKILERLSEIKEMLYDIPWYGLTPKQRKMLVMVMNCDHIQGGFSAAGIHDLSMERFGIDLKAGYTNLLVLKDLVQK